MRLNSPQKPVLRSFDGRSSMPHSAGDSVNALIDEKTVATEMVMANGPVQPAGDARHHDGRHEHRQQHQRRGHHRAGDLDHRLGGGLLGVETLVVDQTQGVLDDHDGVVDDDADHQDQAEHRQRVDRQADRQHHANVPSSETGIVIAGTSVVRKSCRKM